MITPNQGTIHSCPIQSVENQILWPRDREYHISIHHVGAEVLRWQDQGPAPTHCSLRLGISVTYNVPIALHYFSYSHQF
jgi:hypothetical protein